MIVACESPEVEFRTSRRAPPPASRASGHKEIAATCAKQQTTALKNIAVFLNGNGGALLARVEDNGTVASIEDGSHDRQTSRTGCWQRQASLNLNQRVMNMLGTDVLATTKLTTAIRSLPAQGA